MEEPLDIRVVSGSITFKADIDEERAAEAVRSKLPAGAPAGTDADVLDALADFDLVCDGMVGSGVTFRAATDGGKVPGMRAGVHDHLMGALRALCPFIEPGSTLALATSYAAGSGSCRPYECLETFLYTGSSALWITEGGDAEPFFLTRGRATQEAGPISRAGA